jgi:hypothetical protein
MEVFRANFLPARVLDKSILCADKVKIGHHAARNGFVEPHFGFFRILRNISPTRSARRIRSSNVSGDLAIEDGVADPPLQAAFPAGWIIISAALIVGLKPRGDRSRFGPPRTLPPELAKKKLQASSPSRSRRISATAPDLDR